MLSGKMVMYKEEVAPVYSGGYSSPKHNQYWLDGMKEKIEQATEEADKLGYTIGTRVLINSTGVVGNICAIDNYPAICYGGTDDAAPEIFRIHYLTTNGIPSYTRASLDDIVHYIGEPNHEGC